MGNEIFEITENRKLETSTFVLKGRIYTANANTLLYKLESAFKEGQINIILNMLEVGYLSSSGIRVILKMYKQTREAGGKFCIEAPSENVRNVLGLVALDEMLIT